MKRLIGTGASASASRADRPDGVLMPFEDVFAPVVAGWVRSDDELFHLTPKTPPPITPEKVIGWRRPLGFPMLYWRDGAAEPCGYAELNRTELGEARWWLGHCLVAPDQRSRGVGLTMVRLLLGMAFQRKAAHVVSLIVFPGNLNAVRCYRRAGFSERGEVFRRFETRAGEHRMIHMSIDRHEYAYRQQSCEPG